MQCSSGNRTVVQLTLCREWIAQQCCTDTNGRCCCCASRRYTLDNPAGAQPSWLDPDLQPMALGRKTNDWLMGPDL
eukprot:CAMPEP_0204181238 /NCGR_PEP_ID=MMETSP0361-20130328/51721_1 /ASSEMBLY_ACC=CAM_ASM_000343 /TAXON_ID=268821 /ORGANISM="Scrippsiella Hangoei, Strain SHTV-5" /LENGTH=75 /DNA_ID=CAMNT_0051140785 /DNA_START=37 /DNA_END=261 /DNA_ORIENTATION=-